MAFIIVIKKYRHFYETYKDKLFRYLMFKCGNYEVSRDIMQEIPGTALLLHRHFFLQLHATP
jgi:DNA-directed RNA polymerase specialized sigma24 family protein